LVIALVLGNQAQNCQLAVCGVDLKETAWVDGPAVLEPLDSGLRVSFGGAFELDG